MPATDPVTERLNWLCTRLDAARTSPESFDLEGLLGEAVAALQGPAAVLNQHRAGRVAVFGDLCARHKDHRHFSITSTEGADVAACPACAATVYTECAGCGPGMRLDTCPARGAISGALLSTKEGTGGN